MKIFYCQHIIDTLTDGTTIQGPYIYKAGGIGKAHYCVRVNNGGYLFVIPEENVPVWFSGDKNVVCLGDTKDSIEPSLQTKTLLSETLSLPSSKLTGVVGSNLWRNIFVNTSINLDFDSIERNIDLGKSVFSSVLNEKL